METKLVKLDKDKYTLIYKEGDTSWEHNPELDENLSLKNCQAIELGYDLDELAWKEFPYHEWEYSNGSFGDINEENRETFKIGFQKALEILGDKKFSEEDMRRALSAGLSIGYGRQFEIENKQVEIDSYIKSLQQTEWDVEIEMEDGTIVYPDGENEIISQPRLDKDGCLILKRK